MNKACIFDFDGVLINSESCWDEKKQQIYKKLIGEELFLAMGSTRGMSIDAIYDKAVSLGAYIDREIMIKEIFTQAHDIYSSAPLTPGIDSIGEALIQTGYTLGIVSASPMERIRLALDRSSLSQHITHIISLQDRIDLADKPSPDGYQEMIYTLDTTPQSTIIIEDSNIGIQSAKASGAFVIGFREYLDKGNKITGADKYADNLNEVLSIINYL